MIFVYAQVAVSLYDLKGKIYKMETKQNEDDVEPICQYYDLKSFMLTLTPVTINLELNFELSWILSPVGETSPM